MACRLRPQATHHYKYSIAARLPRELILIVRLLTLVLADSTGFALKAQSGTRIIAAMNIHLIRSRPAARTLLAGIVCLAALSCASASGNALQVSASYKKNAEKAFRTFLQDLWPEARQRGDFAQGFRCIRKAHRPCNGSIPDLAPPKIAGEQPAASRKRQAEFGSPGRYFK